MNPSIMDQQLVYAQKEKELTWERDSLGKREHRVCLFLLWASRSTNITDQEQPCRAEANKHHKSNIIMAILLPSQCLLQAIVGLQTLQTRNQKEIKPAPLSTKPHNHAAHMQHLPKNHSFSEFTLSSWCVTPQQFQITARKTLKPPSPSLSPSEIHNLNSARRHTSTPT